VLFAWRAANSFVWDSVQFRKWYVITFRRSWTFLAKARGEQKSVWPSSPAARSRGPPVGKRRQVCPPRQFQQRGGRAPRARERAPG
ncbi:hypothetical protein MCOR22_011686, partial [Pyricularia oryzae]